MSMRRRARNLMPRPLRQAIYDRRRSGRRQWRESPGVERIPAAAGVALTFDDGPDPKFTSPLLDALGDAGATATFFVVGERVGGQEELLREIVARGHEVALHGMTHRRHDSLSEAEARAELGAGLVAIEGAGVPRPTFYRPPYGASSPTLARVAAELGLRIAYWSSWGQDWEPLGAERIASLVIRDLRPGAVILLHDSPLYAEREDARPTIEAVPAIVASARAQGAEVLALGAALPAAG